MRKRLFLFLSTLILAAVFPWHCSAKLVIADGGGSGYITRNSLAATTLAVAMKADIIKLDLVLSKDNEVVVFSSPYLEDASDVAEVFPERNREDQHYYVLDFTLEELRQLRLKDPAERMLASLSPHFSITTLGEQLSLIQSLEISLGRAIRIAVTLVKPWIHKREKCELSRPVLSLLQQYGYTGQQNKILLLSYDVEELQYISEQLLPLMQMQIQLVQLIDQPDGQEYMVKEWGEYQSYNYDLLFSNSGLRALAAYVAAIGLPRYMLADAAGNVKHADFINNAHKLETMIFTYPVQKNAQQQTASPRNFEEELEFLYYTVGVDGVFTDFCDDVSRFLKNRTAAPPVTDNETVLPPANATSTNDPLNLTSPLDMEN